MMRKMGCIKMKVGRGSIAWTVTYHSTTKATQLSGVARWRENIKYTELRGFARWRGKRYSYLVSCTPVTLIIPTILPETSSNLETRETTTITAVGRKFTTENRNHEQDTPNH